MKLNDYWVGIRTYIKLYWRAGLRGVIACKRLPKGIISNLKKVGLDLENRDILVNLREYEIPFWLRYQTSDSRVFFQIFIDQEYEGLTDLDDPKLIIDCGANVGYSALYFLYHYPNAHVIAIEPDADHFRMCEKNLAPFRDRVTLIQAGVWSRETGLVVCRETEDGLSWGFQVRECESDETPETMAIDLGTVLKQSGFERIDLLKMDVERSEIEIFSRNYDSWLNKVDHIAIELHGEDCSTKFFSALSSYEYDLSNSGELTICQNLKPKSVLQVR